MTVLFFQLLYPWRVSFQNTSGHVVLKLFSFGFCDSLCQCVIRILFDFRSNFEAATFEFQFKDFNLILWFCTFNDISHVSRSDSYVEGIRDLTWKARRRFRSLLSWRVISKLYLNFFFLRMGVDCPRRSVELADLSFLLRRIKFQNHWFLHDWLVFHFLTGRRHRALD